MKRLAIIGGGAAGMLCAALTAQSGLETVLFEHSENRVKKYYLPETANVT